MISGETLKIEKKILTALQKKLLFLPHAIKQMSRPDRMISKDDIRKAIINGEIIEDYPYDSRGHSCLVLGKDLNNRSIHIVCTPKKDYLAIITAYIPWTEQWTSDLKKRRK